MKFVPSGFSPRDVDIEWAMQEFNINKDEVERQFILMSDHEFRRSYTDWNRVFRNWMRKAEEIGSLKREFKHRKVEPLSDDQRDADIIAFDRDMKRLGVKK